nr:unnamed protein product [Callosobruchus chinensis]
MYLHLATALKCLQAWISLGRAPFMMPVFGPIVQSNQLSAEIKFVLFSLGDSGFGIAPWLMTPFRTPNNPQQQAFNNLLTRERVIIERLATEKVPHIIACCFILHNVAKYLKDSDFPAEENHEENFNGAQIEDENIRVRDRGNMRRIDIANIIYEMNRKYKELESVSDPGIN